MHRVLTGIFLIFSIIYLIIICLYYYVFIIDSVISITHYLIKRGTGPEKDIGDKGTSGSKNGGRGPGPSEGGTPVYPSSSRRGKDKEDKEAIDAEGFRPITAKSGSFGLSTKQAAQNYIDSCEAVSSGKLPYRKRRETCERLNADFDNTVADMPTISSCSKQMEHEEYKCIEKKWNLSLVILITQNKMWAISVKGL